MSDFRFELNSDGVRELLKSAEMQNKVNEVGERILEACGDGYEVKHNVGRTRASCTVHPATAKAYYSNRKHRTLQKALGGVAKA
jgi:hypothetical protein